MIKLILPFVLYSLIVSCTSTYGEKNKKNIEQIIPVRTQMLTPQKYIKKIKGTGKVISAQQASLMFEVPGKIIELSCKVGQQIEKGEIIAKLNNDVYKAKYQLTETALNKANRDLKNIEKLFKKDAVSKDQLLQVKLSQKNAKSDFITAKYAFESTELKAPFDGTITHINLQVGELFSPGPLPFPSVILSNMARLKLETHISNKEILNLKNGQIASITFPLDNSIEPLSGIVSEVGFVPITMSNSYKMLIDIQESSPNLKLGMIMNFSVQVSKIDSIYLLSNRYILDDKIGNFIWINDNSIAKKIPVNTGDLVGHEIIIEGNLNPGTMVVTDGNRQIKNGSRLKVVK